jgi:hypothetical protein
MKDILVDGVGTGLRDFISALVYPLQSLTSEMNTFEADAKKRARLNGQKMVLEAGLNSIFGVTIDPKILINNNSADATQAIYNDSELIDVFFFSSAENDPKYFLNDSEASVIPYDFLVRIPTGIYSAELERRIRNEVTIYKLAGTRFLIEQY